MDNERVIFRKFPEGDVIALFPDISADVENTLMVSYQHIGQHGGSSERLVNSTTLATEEEYKDLKKELELIGYKLRVVKRMSNPQYRNGRY